MMHWYATMTGDGTAVCRLLMAMGDGFNAARVIVQLQSHVVLLVMLHSSRCCLFVVPLMILIDLYLIERY